MGSKRTKESSSRTTPSSTSRRARKARAKSPAPQPKGEATLRNEIAEVITRVAAPEGSGNATGAEDPSRTWSETHCGTLADGQFDSTRHLQRRFYRVGTGHSLTPISNSHSASAVAVVTRGLESLSETLPAVLQVANGVAPQGIRYASRDTLISAIDMLNAYRNHRESREMESDGRMITEALDAAKQEGIALGIEQEKRRVKEARRGRNQKY